MRLPISPHRRGGASIKGLALAQNFNSAIISQQFHFVNKFYQCKFVGALWDKRIVFARNCMITNLPHPKCFLQQAKFSARLVLISKVNFAEASRRRRGALAVVPCMQLQRKKEQVAVTYSFFGGTTQIRTGGEAFAELCLTSWLWCQLPKHCTKRYKKNQQFLSKFSIFVCFGCLHIF